jgi:hypothetical protein
MMAERGLSLAHTTTQLALMPFSPARRSMPNLWRTSGSGRRAHEHVIHYRSRSSAENRSDRESYLDLEVPIREVTFMAGIARDLAYELLDVETRKNPDSYVVIRMSIRQYEQFSFAIDDVHGRASALEKLYHGK